MTLLAGRMVILLKMWPRKDQVKQRTMQRLSSLAKRLGLIWEKKRRDRVDKGIKICFIKVNKISVSLNFHHQAAINKMTLIIKILLDLV